MPKRVTIVFDDITYKKLLSRHFAEIKKSTKFVSFSSVVNDVLRKSIHFKL
jgi:hypothetical protein